ncbi:hypothetical protein [Microbacterium sp. Leaf159]|uniref:hypothetical protein n=1 Tax=Microbacterium sp. Leaf159 TaxID=1736279 RepID=UPI0006F9FD9F|nr:hypothetical protein [Microbacterium sp. Leaf159]KQR37433.1 hypothetical protein ASF80_16885 [Microbacterium sp. Leaf159]
MDIDTRRPRARSARILSPLFGAAVTAALLAGCAAPASPTPTVTQTVTASADPSPSPSPSASSTPTAGVSPSGIGDVELGTPYDDAVAAAGATPVEACPWLATGEADGYMLTIQRPEVSDQDPAVVDLVQVSASPVDLEGKPAVGPLTAEGIGLGSRLDQALAVYPDAVEVESVGDRRYLAIETGAGTGSVFLTYTAGTDIIWGVTATTLDEPPYESCA